MLTGLTDLGYRMNVGKTLFAQVMEFVPWKTFGRITDRHQGDAVVRTLGCADLFRVMAPAQVTWRESLRDIEACLAAHPPKLFHMGLKTPPARSTLADALNRRDWRIYQAVAQRLIARARRLYADDPSPHRREIQPSRVSSGCTRCIFAAGGVPKAATPCGNLLHADEDLEP